MCKAAIYNHEIRNVLNYRWLIFGVLALAYIFVYFHRFALSVVAVDLDKALKTSAGVMGILGSVYFYCYAFMQFPAGLISDSIGPRKGVTIFLFIASCGSILFGLAPNIQMAVLGRFLVGIGVSMVFIPTMKILSQWFRAEEFAFMAALMNAIGGIGMLTSTAPLAFMSGLLGWRISFEIIGVITFFIAILAWMLIRDRPTDMGWPSILQIEAKSGKNLSKGKKIPLWEGLRQVTTNRHFWPIAIWFFFDCGIFFGFGALWSGPYLMHVYGMTQAQAGFILSMIAVGMIGGSPLLSLFSDKVFKSRKKVLMLCSAGLVAVILVLNLFPSELPRLALLIIFLLFSVCSSAIVAIGFTTTKELFPIQIAGTSVGTVNLFPFLGGAIFQPLLGFVIAAFPKTITNEYPLNAYSSMLLVLLGSSFVALLCTLFMRDTFPEKYS